MQVELVPALLLTGLLDVAGQLYFNKSLLYTTYAAQGIDSLKYVVADRHDPTTLIGNLLMLQTIAVAPFGGNGTPFRGEKHPPHGEIAG